MKRPVVQFGLILAAVLCCGVLTGCAGSRGTLGQRIGPITPAAVEAQPWTYEGTPALRLATAHYTIYTTITDPSFSGEIAQVMEAGFSQYQLLVPDLTPSAERMDCYVFATRAQWTDFTRRNTGAIARVYLQINRGGYTLRDWYVAYDIGMLRTYSVAAHEGWHQFAFRNFVGRLPPFLEEGIACLFEDVQIKNDLPRFNLSVNKIRAHALRRAIEAHNLIPLEQLIKLHAGEIVGRSGETIETFYAQNWAFAKFLWEADHAKYRPALQRLIGDTASGNVIDPSGSLRRSINPWDSAAVRPMLEHYLGMPMSEISDRYNAYLHEVAYEFFQEQFAS